MNYGIKRRTEEIDGFERKIGNRAKELNDGGHVEGERERGVMVRGSWLMHLGNQKVVY